MPADPEPIPLVFHPYRDRQGAWRWRLFAMEDMRIIGISSESWELAADCVSAIRQIQASIGGALLLPPSTATHGEDERD